jgi:DNA invertase Pin-like site-specific DNA recombinase
MTEKTTNDWKRDFVPSQHKRKKADGTKKIPDIDLSGVAWTGVRIYMRCSTQEQEERYSLDTQRSVLTEYARDVLKLPVLRIYQDAAVSGATNAEKRPELQKLMTRLKRGDVVLTIETSRLGRDVQTTINTIATIEQRGCRLVCVYDSVDTCQATGTLLANLKSVFAGEERKQLRQRTMATLRYKKSIGEAVGRPPYGYKIVEKKVVPDPETYPHMLMILDMREHGCSYIEIARLLIRRGVKTAQGKVEWTPFATRTICIRQMGEEKARVCGQIKWTKDDESISDEESDRDEIEENGAGGDDVATEQRELDDDVQTESTSVGIATVPEVVAEQNAKQQPQPSNSNAAAANLQEKSVVILRAMLRKRPDLGLKEEEIAALSHEDCVYLLTL